jgi:hypothetical protein
MLPGFEGIECSVVLRASDCNGRGHMSPSRFGFAALALTALITLAACGHKVIVTKGQDSVRIYQSQDIYEAYLKVLNTPQPHDRFYNFLRAAVELKESVEVENRTPIKIISKSKTGATVEVLKGPNKGYEGFVPNENLD